MDEDILRITARASSSFLSTLSREEIKTCILNAIWKALKKYDKQAGTKFTTYLYRGVVMECLTQQKFNLNQSKYFIHKNIAAPEDYNLKHEMMDEVENCDDPDLMYDRFYKNMTIKELAKSRGVCGETIRIKIKKNLKKIRSRLS